MRILVALLSFMAVLSVAQKPLPSAWVRRELVDKITDERTMTWTVMGVPEGHQDRHPTLTVGCSAKLGLFISYVPAVPLEAANNGNIAVTVRFDKMAPINTAAEVMEPESGQFTMNFDHLLLHFIGTRDQLVLRYIDASGDTQTDVIAIAHMPRSEMIAQCGNDFVH